MHTPKLCNQRYAFFLQGSRASTITDSPATSSSWADSGLPASEHRVGKRIAELQKRTQHEDAQPEAAQSEESQLDAAGTMLLSEVNLGGGPGGQGGSAEPLPSSQVLLNDGRVVSVTGNVSVLCFAHVSSTLAQHSNCCLRESHKGQHKPKNHMVPV